MMVLVSYDVATSDRAGAKRLRKLAKICTNHGQRVQYSVFECLVDPAQWVAMRQQLINVIDESQDSLRFYFLGAGWRRKIEHIGAKEAIDQEGPLIL
ncbi:CRISPR-associated protein, Cas2 family [Geoalkalibacter ferrihydriticus]|uniref:CRISPR-associated endoribonuclease Cas2 n=2 Tax=Geoalkalibacter ferrihydriticus TaxID=392333 RepID=A0A0C2HN01_9BACT|nr:CRISPR-associated endonuclease Cas2 [Geoalkalibacter ferrihydriticus]KIH76350.1 CRISPR-associated protein Cas2 [Geoalkalibacter ferrihydriticus DSM 17813]SDL19243.1 CRISPR-associated protein, Cas2 family [Geoalkalibacter ferrihydriticus]